jgi:hypothetical protein
MDVARRKTRRDIDEFPDWMKQLNGYDQLEWQELDAPADEPELKSGTWRILVTGANDPSEISEQMDPLLMLGLIANASFELEARIEQCAKFCRSEGKTWTQIGEALGVSKQAAWERFSGED